MRSRIREHATTRISTDACNTCEQEQSTLLGKEYSGEHRMRVIRMEHAHYLTAPGSCTPVSELHHLFHHLVVLHCPASGCEYASLGPDGGGIPEVPNGKIWSGTSAVTNSYYRRRIELHQLVTIHPLRIVTAAALALVPVVDCIIITGVRVGQELAQTNPKTRSSKMTLLGA